MITINKFQIQNNGSELSIDVNTETGSLITSILLWGFNDFKDYTKAHNLNYKLVQSSHQESFIVTATELGLSSFEDIWFIEIQSDYIPADNCGQFLDPALGITYNLQPYYKCLLNRFFEFNSNPCIDCEHSLIDTLILSIGLTIDILEKAIEEGYYLQAIDLLKKLKKFCNIKKCNNCNVVECSTCSKFKQF